MNKLMANLLTIHERLETVDSFLKIKGHVENLRPDNNFHKLVEDTDLLIKVLNGFSGFCECGQPNCDGHGNYVPR